LVVFPGSSLGTSFFKLGEAGGGPNGIDKPKKKKNGF